MEGKKKKEPLRREEQDLNPNSLSKEHTVSPKGQENRPVPPRYNAVQWGREGSVGPGDGHWNEKGSLSACGSRCRSLASVNFLYYPTQTDSAQTSPRPGAARVWECDISITFTAQSFIWWLLKGWQDTEKAAGFRKQLVRKPQHSCPPLKLCSHRLSGNSSNPHWDTSPLIYLHCFTR